MHQTSVSSPDPQLPSPGTSSSPSSKQPLRGNFGPRRQPLWKRLRRRLTRRGQSRTAETMLPVLIQVFAGFSKVDGKIAETDIDSSLGFLRYDYPETVYSELRGLYARALHESQDLNGIAQNLSKRLPLEEKILLGVQLYVLISRARLQKEHLITFYQFMTNLGVASEAIGIVYQLNTSELGGTAAPEPAGQPLESLMIAGRKPADVVLQTLSDEHSIAAFRFQNLILLKNIGTEPIIVRGHQIRTGEFCRIYEGQRVLIAEVVQDYQDLVFYFNAKKDVSAVQLFLALDHNGTHFIEKARSKQTYLEVKFGLNIIVNVLRDVKARIGKTKMTRGTNLEVSLRDKIVFDDHTEIAISDLRRRARELGGRFELTPARSEYLVSNNSNLLRHGDILLSPNSSGDILLRIKCDFFEKRGELEILEANRPISVNGSPVRGTVALEDGDTVAVGDGQYLRCHFSDRVIEEERNVISSLQVRDLSHYYDRKHPALDSISFSVERGEMICIMGPSGCGKSTMMKTLAGLLKPTEGQIFLNGLDLYDHREDLTPYISYIPHEEALDSLLTVEENIDTAAAIRAPHLSGAERKRRADSKLVELGLNEIRHRLAGDERSKNLSGGQRKRLNAGLDMIGISDVYLFDEPTSGLSSKDSEHVLEIIRGLTHNKITLVSIHQPSSRLFHMFHKAILLDKGGNLAFFGTPTQMLEYFDEARLQEGVRHTAAADNEHLTPSALTPDFVFDVLETPLRDLSGDIIYEQNDRDQLIPARRFSPGFWRDRFQTHRLLQEVHLREIEPDTSGVSKVRLPPKGPQRKLHEEGVHFLSQFKRAFLSKLRNRANLATTLLEAPLLAILIAGVLRYSETGEYNFASAFHIPTYLFLTLVTALFLGLTNSAEDIIRDRILLERERNHRIRVLTYCLAKVLSLSIFALLQCVIYLLIGNAILSIRDMFWHNLFWMFTTSLVGVTSGLFVSSVVNSPKTALNIIPLVLIPNIILGGALIKYEEMNQNLDFIQRWLRPSNADEQSSLKVPLICEVMPLRWSYEAVIIAHAQRNPASALINDIESELQSIINKPGDLSEDEIKRLDAAKQALAVVHGLGGKSANQVSRQIHFIRKALMTGEFNVDSLDRFEKPGDGEKRVTAEELYLNEKILDLFNRAKIEQDDYRRKRPPNVFFGDTKRLHLSLFGDETEFTGSTLWLNGLAMGFFAVGGFLALQVSLSRQMRKV